MWLPHKNKGWCHNCSCFKEVIRLQRFNFIYFYMFLGSLFAFIFHFYSAEKGNISDPDRNWMQVRNQTATRMHKGMYSEECSHCPLTQTDILHVKSKILMFWSSQYPCSLYFMKHRSIVWINTRSPAHWCVRGIHFFLCDFSRTHFLNSSFRYVIILSLPVLLSFSSLSAGVLCVFNVFKILRMSHSTFST